MPHIVSKKKTLLIVIWLITIAYYMYTRMLSTSISALSIPLENTIGFSSVEVAVAISAYGMAMLVMKIPVGILVDRYGIDKPLVIAMLITLIGTVLFAFPINQTTLVCSRFIIGVGASFAMMSAYRLTSIVLSKRLFALATGIIYFCGSFAVSLSGAPLNQAVEVFAYQDIVLLMATILFVIWFVYLLSLSFHGPLPKNEAIRSFKDYFVGLGSIVKDRQIIFTILYASLFTCVFFNTIGYWGNTILLNTKLPSSVNAGLVGNSIASFASGIMSIVVGLMISLQWLRRSHLVISSILSTIAIVIMFYTPIVNMPILIICSCLFGIGFGYTGIAFDTVNKRNQNYLVSALSLLFFIEYVLNTALNPLVAYIKQTLQTNDMTTATSYQIAYGIFLGLMIIANILSFYIKPQKV